MVADSAAWAQAFGRTQRDWPQEGAGDPAEASEDSPQRELAMRIADPAVMRYFASPSSQGARLRATRGRSQKWSRARRWSEFPEVAGVKDPYFDPNAKRPHGSPAPSRRHPERYTMRCPARTGKQHCAVYRTRSANRQEANRLPSDESLNILEALILRAGEEVIEARRPVAVWSAGCVVLTNFDFQAR